ncbi:MAG: hypothetical protein AAF937_04220 [Planctomycetota bacterium]
MMYRRFLGVCAALVLASCGSPAAVGSAEAAKPAPAKPASASAALPPDPDALAIIHEDRAGRRTPVINPRGLPVYEDYGSGLQPEITLERIDELGYDLILDFENTTRRAVELGRINVGIITLGPEVSWLNLNRQSAFAQVARRDFTTQNRRYPGSFYAPVGVLKNDRFAVGVSLLYDVLQDRHSINVNYRAPKGRFSSGPGGAGYSIGFELGNPVGDEEKVEYPAQLVPGERRRYRVAVRAVELDGPIPTRGPQPWLATLEPYREHFQRLYGGVTYARDTRPVRGVVVAGPTAINSSNRMGFIGSASTRPDLAGWDRRVDELMRPSGFERSMLWSAGGLYYSNRHRNYPNRFLSQLLTTPRLASAFDERSGLPKLADSGHQLGLWWGRSTSVSRAWDTPQHEPLNLNRPDTVRLALDEISLADRAGATFIGLDAFTTKEMPLWQQYEWIIRLRQMYPHMTFVAEPMACDILHTLGPTFDIAWRGGDRTGRPDTRYRVQHPHHLADFLLPGHEMWAYFRYQGTTLPRNSAWVQRDAEHLARSGHVPVIKTQSPIPNPERALAQPSWLVTVPDRLKTSAHRTANPPVLSIAGAGDAPDDTGDGQQPGRDRDGDGDTGGDGSADGSGGGSGDGSGDSSGDGRGGSAGGGDDAGPDLANTRPFMLPNGRVIRLPIIKTGK